MSKVYYYDLNKSYELKGYWKFKNGEETEEIAGILKLSKDDIELEIFANIWAFFSRKDNSFDVITGATLNGEPITLIDVNFCHLGETTKLHVGYCIIGEAFDSLEDIVFDNFYICQKDLRNWIWKRTSDLNDNSKEIEYKLTTPEKDFEIKIGDNLVISNFYATNHQWNLYNEPYFEQDVCLVFKSVNKPFFYKDIITKYIYEWNILFSIMVGRVCNIKYVKSKKDKKLIHLFYRKDHFDNRDIPGPSMLIPFSEIKDCFETVLKNWFEESDKIKMYAKELFMSGFETWSLGHLTKEGFLNLFQAIEGLSEIKEQSYSVDKEIIDELVEIAKKFFEEKNIASNVAKKIYMRIPGLNNKKPANTLVENFVQNNVDREISELLKIDKDYIDNMTTIRHTLSHNKGENYYDIITHTEFQNMYLKMIILLFYVFTVNYGIDKNIVINGIKNRCSWIKNFTFHLNKSE